MKRRSFFATVIGGACAAIWPWKATSNEPTGGYFTISCGDKGVWIYGYPQGNAEAESEMMKLASTKTDGRIIILLPNQGHSLTIDYIPPKGKVSINNGTTRDS